jgi:hypothetical protein
VKIIFVLIALAFSSSAYAETPKFKTGQTYASFRESLIKQNWRPVHDPMPSFVCDKGDPRCEGREETVVCAGTGRANCIFRWEKDKTKIDVETIGETDPIVDQVKCSEHC